MATERIEIIITEKGSRTVKRDIESIGAAANKTDSALGFMKRALAAIASVAVIRGLISLADAFTNIQNRIGTVTESSAELALVTERLFQISNQTRASFEATAEIYTRTALAVQELGLAQQVTLEFTESLNQAVVLSGAGVREANNALIQLSQGLASGVLRGDELRSVLEQLPVVADVIAKGLGVTRGELRAMGAEGKITAEEVIKAFAAARQELAERFAKTVPTIGQSFLVLRNAVIQFIGTFDKANGISAAISKTLLLVAENFDTVARAVLATATTLGVTFAAQAVPRAITAVRALTAAMAANPIGAIAVALTTVISLLIAFDDRIRLSSEGAATLQDLFVAAFEIIKEGVQAAAEFFRTNFGFIIDIVRLAFGDIEFSFKGFLQIVAKGIDFQLGIWKGLFNAVKAIFNNFPDLIDEAFVVVIRKSIDFVNQVVEIMNTIPGIELELLEQPKLIETSRGTGAKVAEAFAEGVQSVTPAQNALGALLDRAEDVAQRRLAEQAQSDAERQAAEAGLGQAGEAKGGGRVPGSSFTIEQVMEDLAREKRLLSEVGQQRDILNQIMRIENGLRRELSSEERTSIENQLQELQLLQIRGDLLQEIKGPQDVLIDTQSELNKLFAEGAITALQYEQALTKLKIQQLEIATTSTEGFRRGFLRVKEDLLDVAGAAENVVVNAFSSAEDALVNFVKTGEFSISSLVDSILADLTRLLAREAFSSLIGAFGGAAGGGGGIFGSLLGAFGGAKADGGSVSPNKAFLVGERGPELFVPPSQGNIVPNQALMQQAAQQPVNVQVVNVEKETDVPAAMSSRAGDQVIINSLTRNRQAVKAGLGLF